MLDKLESIINIAANNVKSLRKIDVERVLESAQENDCLGAMTLFLLNERADLKSEVFEILEELK